MSVTQTPGHVLPWIDAPSYQSVPIASRYASLLKRQLPVFANCSSRGIITAGIARDQNERLCALVGQPDSETRHDCIHDLVAFTRRRGFQGSDDAVVEGAFHVSRGRWGNGRATHIG